MNASDHPPGAIAIIGMACRFPGAVGPDAFWRNLRDGEESIKFFSDEELLAAGVDPEQLRRPNYVKAAPVLRDIDKFDAAFFDYSPREATATDPQHRLFLEVAWEAFEEAGYFPETCPGSVGVFAGGGGIVSSYLVAYPRHPALTGDTATLPYIGNDKDFIATKVSYKLNLTGPSVTVQTACSTSLVAVHLACQSLVTGESDMVLAGAATVRVPHVSGYLSEPGNVHSPDGKCRSFDANGKGVVFGSGVGAVLLRRLEDALDAGDQIRAVIKGTSVKNDGRHKSSFSSPSVAGQSRTMVDALAKANVLPDSIDYVECHAAGTPVGDPIEINALTEAFRTGTSRTGYCAVGSVKPNIGHPEQSAGMAGLMKTVFALEHGQIPPSLNCETLNPEIDFARSPFFVNTKLRDWPVNGHPRRACVNSLGLGGTNAFAVLEQAPVSTSRSTNPGRAHHVFTLSAKSEAALSSYVDRFRDFLSEHRHIDLADLCYTSNVSRSQFEHRVAVTAATIDELANELPAAERFHGTPCSRNVAFLFTGQGTHYPGMSAELYRTHPVYRDVLDKCNAAFSPHLNRPLLEVMFAEDDVSLSLLDQMAYMQPALFALEYGLATLWQSWGVGPKAVIGHSLGEIVAACVAGVIEFDDAVTLVATRGRLMQELPELGAMAAVFASQDTVNRYLPTNGAVVIAAANASANTVISGDREAIDEVVDRLVAEGIESRRLSLSNGYHSHLVEPMLDAFEEVARQVTSVTPRIPMVSNLTGRLIEQPPGPRYWCEHARHTVRFADGVRALDEVGCDTFIEMGPGSTLLGLASQVLTDPERMWLPSLSSLQPDWQTMLEAARALYLEGLPIDWDTVHEGGQHQRISLPTYPFQRKRYWVDEVHAETRVSATAPEIRTAPAAQRVRLDAIASRPSRVEAVARLPVVRPEDADLEERPLPQQARAAARDDRISEWLYRLHWQELSRSQRMTTESVEPGSWLVLSDSQGLGARLAEALQGRGDHCHLVFPGQAFAHERSSEWTIDSASFEHFRTLVRSVGEADTPPVRGAIYLWGLDTPSLENLSTEGFGIAETLVARGALHLARAMGEAHASGTFSARLYFVTRNAVSVDTSDPAIEAVQALLWGLGRTFALERRALWGGLVDLPANQTGAPRDVEALVETVCATDDEDQIAYRDDRRFGARLVASASKRSDLTPSVFRSDATYLITGGLGMIGLRIARWLVEHQGVRSIVLTGRSAPSSESAESVEALRRLGARVQIVPADVGVEADVQRLMEAMDGLPSVRGVIHGAGVLDNALVTQMDWQQFTRVTGPKVRGAWLLHRYTRELELDFFVLHSSLLSLIGSAGQGNYTAANAFLDALGTHRRAQGLPATVINWTAWAEGGLASTAGRRNEALWRDMGLSYIAPDDGIQAFKQLMCPPADQVAVSIADWPRYLRQFPTPPALYANLIGRGASSTDAAPERQPQLLDLVRQRVSEQMGFDELIDPRQPLRELGLDSLMAATLASRLSTVFDVVVPVVKLIGGPSIMQLVEDLAPMLVDYQCPAPDSADPATVRSATVAPIGTSRTAGNGWLVFPRPNPSAALRLFCFPYAGGNAATYRPWIESLRDDVELVAIEPPGRADRIHEPVIDSLDHFFAELLPVMQPYLEKPSAFFGHCLGALTLFEAARRLMGDRSFDLHHLFVSGARPPGNLLRMGEFEEGLLARLLAIPKFDPFVHLYEQPGEVFAELIRHFNIGLSEDFLASSELQDLLMPAIRAEFRMASRYRYRREPPWDTPITCFAGIDDPYATREDALGWSEHTRSRFQLHLCEGDHFLVADDRDFIVETINRELVA